MDRTAHGEFSLFLPALGKRRLYVIVQYHSSAFLYKGRNRLVVVQSAPLPVFSGIDGHVGVPDQGGKNSPVDRDNLTGTIGASGESSVNLCRPIAREEPSNPWTKRQARRMLGYLDLPQRSAPLFKAIRLAAWPDETGAG